MRIQQSLLSEVHIEGFLTIREYDAKTRRLRRTIHVKNTVTNSTANISRALFAQRVADGDVSELQVGSMRFGTNGAAAERSQTNLLGEVVAIRKQLLDINKVSGLQGEITFLATLEGSEGNGNTLREVALFTKGATWNNDVGGNLMMLARQSTGNMDKEVGVALDYSWTWRFTVN